MPDLDGLRLTCFATNAKGGQLADLELRHRRRARCEDRIRGARDTGLRNLPCTTPPRTRSGWRSSPRTRPPRLNADARPDPRHPPLGTQEAPPAPVLRCRPTRARWLPPLAPLHRPMTLDRRHHPRLRPAPHPAEPRLTSRFDRPDNPRHRTGEVEPSAHPTREPGHQSAPPPPPKKKTPPHKHKVPVSKLTGTHEWSRLTSSDKPAKLIPRQQEHQLLCSSGTAPRSSEHSTTDTFPMFIQSADH